MFFFPVGHEEDRYHRLPVVALGFMALCVVVFGLTQLLASRAEARARTLAEAVLEYAERYPELEVDEEFLFATTDVQLERGWSQDGLWTMPAEEEPGEAERRELERLTEQWRAAYRAAPAYRFGLTPKDLDPFNLVSHIFVHAGWLHLIGNLFFFWLVGPPLEDVWGRPLFGLMVIALGVTAGLLWVARYPNSAEPVIGASGAIAGLMGAFMVRFWRSKIRMFYVVFIVLRIKTGFFMAPAWAVLGLWVAREIALGTWLEPHSMPAGGVATWAHVFGFGAGAVGALAIKMLRVEERWVTPAVTEATGGVDNSAIDEASTLQAQGRIEEAWRLLAEECRAGRGTGDVVASWWDLAIDCGRQEEVVPWVLRSIQRQLGRKEIDLACRQWLELRDHVATPAVPPGLAVALAAALVEWGGPKEESSALLAGAREALGPEPPSGLLLRFARAGSRVRLAGIRDFCLAHAERADVEPEVREELRRLAMSIS